jgi:hypothetical protein
MFDYVDANGRRKQKSAGSFDDKKSANAVALKIEMKKSRNQFVAPQNETVREFVKRWIPIRANLRRWSHSYLDSATGLLEQHVFPEIGDMPMQSVLPLHIDSLFAKLRVKRCGGCKRFNKSEETIPFLTAVYYALHAQVAADAGFSAR